jgi:transposase-like protein
MRCKFCEGEDFRLDGKVRGKQRYFCKGCERRFTDAPPKAPRAIKLQALTLYISGLFMNCISKLLQIRVTSIIRWIRGLSSTAGLKPSPEEGSVILLEVDEFWHDVKKKSAMLDLQGF